MGRSREGPRKFLRQFNGYLQSDGYGAYDCIGGEGLIHCGCMAHARRGFIDALKMEPGDKSAQGIVARIGKLYAVEKSDREIGLSPCERGCLRQLRSMPPLTDLKKMIIALREEGVAEECPGQAV
jgi:transposase